MKVYKDNKVMNADKEQMDIVLGAGWSKIKPESKEVKKEKVTVAPAIREEPVTEAKPASPKPKKIRKATPKKS